MNLTTKENIFNLKTLLNKKVSIIIKGLNKLETYIGRFSLITDDFLVLDIITDNKNYTITQVIFRKELLSSVWVYKE